MDIKESKEYRLAKDWEMAVNSFSFNPERFAAAIPDMHPTLQQSLYRLIKACIKVMADETRHYDERNQASHEEAECASIWLFGDPTAGKGQARSKQNARSSGTGSTQRRV